MERCNTFNMGSTETRTLLSNSSIQWVDTSVKSKYVTKGLTVSIASLIFGNQFWQNNKISDSKNRIT